MPRAKQARCIPSEDEEQIVIRKRAVELPQRIDGVGPSAPLHLDVRNLEPRLAVNREFDHAEPVLRRGPRRPPMGRLGAGNKDDPFKVSALHRRFSHRHVTDVDRVERPAENSEPQGWYSNSASAMRTVSPGSTPAASSAALTPRRSSSPWNRASAPSESRSVRSTRCSTRSPLTA